MVFERRGELMIHYHNMSELVLNVLSFDKKDAMTIDEIVEAILLKYSKTPFSIDYFSVQKKLGYLKKIAWLII